MATLPGRIRRISLDIGTPTNYTLEATTSYDSTVPAAGPSVWGADSDVNAMDQSFAIAVPPALLVAGNMGCLITFLRFPKYCRGIVTKVKPTYDGDAGEDPYLEFWTHDSVTTDWTLRRRVQLRNGFVGCPSGKVKYFDFRLAADLPTVDQMWVTLAPGAVGSPVISFVGVHCFGKCRNVPVTDGNCAHDPTVDCIPSDPCVLEPESCLVPIEDCNDLDPDVCTIPPFDWPTLPPPVGGPTPKYQPPEFPLIDLCDAAAVTAYKEGLTEEQLAFFTELLDAAELPCLETIDETRQPDPVAPINAAPDGSKVLPKQPIETYLDPETLEPEKDPKGGTTGSIPPSYSTIITRNLFFFTTTAERDQFLITKDTVEDADVVAAWDSGESEVVIFGNGNNGEPGGGAGWSQTAIDRIFFVIHGAATGDIIEILAKRSSSHFAYASDVSPPKFWAFPGSRLSASISASYINHFLVNLAARLATIPGTTPEVGGTGVATERQSKAIVITGEGVPIIEVVAAHDPNTGLFTDPVASDEGIHGNIHKHIITGTDPAPPFGAVVQCHHPLLFFTVKITKNLAGWDPGDPLSNVYVTQIYTTTGS